MPGSATLAPPHALLSRQPRRWPRLRTVLVPPLLLTLALAGAACSDDKPESPTAGDTLPDTTTTEPAPTTTGPTTTTTTPPTPEEEVEAAYLDIVESYFRRLENPNPDDPTIAENHTGASLEVTRTRNEEALRSGQIDRFPSGSPPVPEILEVQLQGATLAVIEICLVDDVQVIERASGTVVNDEVATSLIEATLVLEESQWKVSEQNRLQRWPDAEGCDR